MSETDAANKIHQELGQDLKIFEHSIQVSVEESGCDKMMEQRRRYSTVGMTNEYRFSQTCVWCFQQTRPACSQLQEPICLHESLTPVNIYTGQHTLNIERIQ
ncbi:12135_t:CDS:2 [Entrophospora sp. SA101]|nr:12135_t:CDS:2 [Entrophospora sp. SA101]